MNLKSLGGFDVVVRRDGTSPHAVRVMVMVDAQELANQLGVKAANSKGQKSRSAKGAVVVKVLT